MILALLLTLLGSFASQTQAHYGRADVEALRAVCARAQTRADGLLCRYRLYPLTEEAALLADLPTDLGTATARELALLSGLYGYRAARATLPGMIRNGRRAVRFLEAAQALDAEDPYVLLVGGQSLLFRPALFGGDPEAALRQFETLAHVVVTAPESGVGAVEAEMWRWYALHRLARPEAPALRQQLLARRPPSLYADFLRSPP